MTDTSILPTTEDGAALPGAPAGPDFADEPTDDRRRLLIIGGAVALVLVAVVAYLLLHGGGSSSPSSAGTGLVPRGTPHAVAPPPASSHSGSTTTNQPKAGTALPKKSHRSLARDPFKPLVVDNTAASAATGGTTTVSSSPSTAPGTVPTSPANGGAPSASAGAPTSIRLVSLHGDQSAVFDVSYRHGKTFRFDVVAPAANSSSGTVFAQDFALLGIQGNEATIQIGDDTPFDLKRGSSHPA